MRTYHIAWWNLENLFDEEDAVALGRRTDKVFRAIKNDIAGWTPQLRDRKIDQLATVIAAMNTGNGPDLLGVCEVENRFVVDRLVERVNAPLPAPRSYAVVHADTGDARGIDVAFIYDDTLFQVPLPLEESVFFHVVMRRNATREIVQVNFKTTTAAPGPGRSSATIGPAAAAVSSSPRATVPLPGRRSATSTSGSSRCTEPRHRCSRWATSTTNRSTPPWFDTHSAPGSEPRSPMRGKTRCCGISCGQTRVCPMAASTSTTSPTCSISSWSTRTWPPATPRSRSTRRRRKSSNRRPWSIQVTTQSRSRSAEWAIRSIRTDSPTTSQSP